MTTMMMVWLVALKPWDAESENIYAEKRKLDTHQSFEIKICSSDYLIGISRKLGIGNRK